MSHLIQSFNEIGKHPLQLRPRKESYRKKLVITHTSSNLEDLTQYKTISIKA